jgi:hypothetical protein
MAEESNANGVIHHTRPTYRHPGVGSKALINPKRTVELRRS